MARKTDIRLRRSNTENAIPTHGNLNDGELAMNTYDGALYFKKSDNTIITAHDNTILHLNSNTSRVGIGTTSPAGNLHVKSVGDVGDALLIVEADADNNVEGDNPKIELRQDAGFVTGAMYLEGNAASQATNSLQNGFLLDAKGASSDGGTIQFATGGLSANQSGGPTNSAVRMTILRDGNIAIGQITSSHKLTVAGNTFLSGDNRHVYFGGNNTFIGENSNSSKLELRGGGSSTSETVYVNSNGAVGIGIIAPTEKLHVVGNAIFHSGAAYGDLVVGRGSNQEIKLYANDANTQIIGYQDSDSDGNHSFDIIREFDGAGENDFTIRKGSGSVQFDINKDGNITFNNAFTFPNADGQADQILKTDGSGTLTWANDSGGGSSVSISDSDNDTLIQVEESTDEDIIRFDVAGSEVAQMTDDGLILNDGYNFEGDVIGAIKFKAQAGEALTKGDTVYISGISGNNTIVSKADANDAAKMPAFGLAASTVSLNAAVQIVTFGTLQGIDTSSYSEGDELYVNVLAGTLTDSAPTGSTSALQKIAKVTRSDASAGSVKVSGAGRTNATPNLDEGKIFVGNASNKSVQGDDTLYVDMANSRVGVNTTSPGRSLHVDGTVRINGGTGVGSTGVLEVMQNGDTANNAIALTSSNAVSTRIWKNASGTFFIGSSSANNAFQQLVNGNTTINAEEFTIAHANPTLILKDTTDDDDHNILFKDSSDNTIAKISTALPVIDDLNIGTVAAREFNLFTNNTTAMSIDTSQNSVFAGDVSILTGTSAKQASDMLYIGGSGLGSTDAAIYLGNAGDGTGYGWRFFYKGSGDGDENRLIIRSENTGSPVDALSFTQSGQALFGDSIVMGNNEKIYFSSNGAANTASSYLYRASGNATRLLYRDNVLAFDAYQDHSAEFRNSNDDVIFKVAPHATATSSTTTVNNGNFSIANGALNIGGSELSDNNRNVTTNNLTVGGNLTVNGSVTTLNTATLTVDDLNITIADGAANAAAANGAGITVDGANATITYTSAQDEWNFNKNVVIGGKDTAASFPLMIRSDSAHKGLHIEENAGAESWQMGVSVTGDLHFYNSGSNTASVTFEDSGDVGIGVSAPGHKLDVAGNVRVTNNAAFMGTNVAGSSRSLVHLGNDNILRIKGNDAEGSANVMSMIAGGSVGIGTTAPIAKLDVNGSINVKQATSIALGQDTSSTVAILIPRGSKIASNSSGNYIRNIIEHGGTTGNGPINIGQQGTAIITDINLYPGSSGKMQVFSDGTSTAKVVIDSAGKMSIGNNNPEYNLDIRGDSPVLRIADDNLNNVEDAAAIWFGENDTSESRGAGITYDGANNALHFRTSNNGATLTDPFDSEKRMTILETNGNVGINITDPDEKLEVNGSIKVDYSSTNANMFKQGNAFGGGSITPFNNSGHFVFNVEYTAGDSDYIWRVNDTTELMRLEEQGQLGIGTNNPTERLHVSNLTGGETKIRIDSLDNARNNYIGITGHDNLVLSADAGQEGADSSIRFNVDNAEVGRFTHHGRFGVGGIIPATTLEISDSAPKLRITDTRNISWTVGDTMASIEFDSDDSSGGAGTSAEPRAAITMYAASTFGSSSGLAFHTKSDTTDYPTRQMVITNDGKVAIGTLTANAKLHVSDASAPTFRLSRTGTGQIWQQSIDSSGRFLLQEGASEGGTKYTRFAIDDDGNVGIGTVDPGRKLHVEGDNNTAITVVSPNTNYAQIALGDTDDDNYAQLILDNATNKLQLQNGGGGVVGERGITLDSSEKVGIGTSSPREELEVNGTIFATPASYAANQNTYVLKVGATNNTAWDGMGFKLKSLSGGSPYLSVMGSPSVETMVWKSQHVGMGIADPSVSGSRTTLHIDNVSNGSAIRLSQNDSGALFRYDTTAGLKIGTISTENLTLETDDTARLVIAADTGNVLIGTTTAQPEKLYVNGATRIVGQGNTQPAFEVFTSQDNDATDNYNAMFIDYNVSGSQTIVSDDTLHKALYIDVDSSATGGTTADEHRLYGMHIDLDFNGDSDVVYGSLVKAESNTTAGQVTSLYGVYGQAVNDTSGTGKVLNSYGGYFNAQFQHSSTNTTRDQNLIGAYARAAVVASADGGGMNDITGLFAEIEIDDIGQAGVMDNAYVVRAYYDNDDTANNYLDMASTYLFHGTYGGGIPANANNAYGMHISTNVNNYLLGSLGIGIETTGQTWAYKLDVQGEANKAATRIRNNTVTSSDWWSNSQAALLIGNVDTSESAILKFESASSRIVYGSASTDDKLVFSSRHSTSASSDQVVFDNNGNVGLGTTAPAQQLHIKKTVTDTTTAGLAGIRLQNDDTDTNSKTGIVFQKARPTSGTSTSYLYQDSYNMTMDCDEAFTVKNNGSNSLHIGGTGLIGINNPSPDYRLDIGNQSSPSTTNTIRIGQQNSGTAIRIGAGGGSSDVVLLRVDGDSTDNKHDGTTDAGAYGFSLKYMGSRSGNENSLAIMSDNGGNVTQVEALTVLQAGEVGIFNASPKARFQVEEYGIDTTETSSSATTEIAIHTFPIAYFRSARFTVQVTNSTDNTYHTTELLALHDGTTANITEFGTVFTGSAIEAQFDADVNSGNFRLLATPSSTDSMEFKVVCHSLTV